MRDKLEEEMRRGFVELAGARMRVRSAAVPFNSTTWPASTEARLTVSGSESLQIDDENNAAFLRSWLGGARPSDDVLAAQRSFREVLSNALKLAEIQQSLASGRA